MKYECQNCGILVGDESATWNGEAQCHVATRPACGAHVATCPACGAQSVFGGAKASLRPLGISDLAGTYRDDPTLREICAEAYRLRDAERQP